MELQKQVGIEIVKRRKELGISQDELAQRSGICRRYVSDIENGTRQVSINVLKSLTDQLDWTLTTLFSKVEPQAKLTIETPEESISRALKLGKVIKNHRKEANLTEDRLAEIIGITKNRVQEMETGTNTVSMECLEKIAIALRMTLSQLFKETEEIS